MIKSTMEKHELRWLVRMNNYKKLDFSIAIQRKEVWDLKHKSNLIASVLIGIPIESLLLEEDGVDDGYLVLDGKQRGTSFIQYVRGDYAIDSTCKIQEIDEVNIIGKYFSDLPEGLQNRLLDSELTFSVLRPLSEDERETIFFMRNQAVALKNTELTRVLLGSVNMDIVHSLCSHEFFTKCNISTKGYVDQQLTLECLLLETGKDYGFSGADMSKFAEELKTEGISNELKETLTKVFDYLNNALVEKFRLLRKIHVPMVYSVAKIAMINGLSPEEFLIWVKKFFEDTMGDNNDYVKAYSNSSAVKANVQRRIVYMTEHYQNNAFTQVKLNDENGVA